MTHMYTVGSTMYNDIAEYILASNPGPLSLSNSLKRKKNENGGEREGLVQYDVEVG